MKTLFAILTLFCMEKTFAQGATVLQANDISLSDAKARFYSINEICRRIPGRESCSTVGSFVTLKITLNGCRDRLGGHFTKFAMVEGRPVVFFGGVNIGNKESLTTDCQEAPVEYITIRVPYEGKEVSVVNIDYVALHPYE